MKILVYPTDHTPVIVFKIKEQRVCIYLSFYMHEFQNMMEKVRYLKKHNIIKVDHNHHILS